MPRPRILAVTLLLLISVVLTACGTDDSSDPTPEPTATRSPVLPTEMPGTTEIAEASPTATGRATATSTTRVATPTVATPSVIIQPVESVTATVAIVTQATPAQASPVVASPVPQGVSTPVAVTLVLTGAEQVDYVVTEEGCVGLGQWRSLKPGAQLVVRDANGTVVDIATLEAGDGACSWTADITAPGSEFVSISIPMATEVWFTQADIEAGEVEITLP